MKVVDAASHLPMNLSQDLLTCCHAGESGVDQLVEIIKVLGTPSREEIHAMNPNYTEFKFPQIKAHPWAKVFSKRMPPDAVDLVSWGRQHLMVFLTDLFSGDLCQSCWLYSRACCWRWLASLIWYLVDLRETPEALMVMSVLG